MINKDKCVLSIEKRIISKVCDTILLFIDIATDCILQDAHLTIQHVFFQY